MSSARVVIAEVSCMPPPDASEPFIVAEARRRGCAFVLHDVAGELTGALRSVDELLDALAAIYAQPQPVDVLLHVGEATREALAAAGVPAVELSAQAGAAVLERWGNPGSLQ